MPRLPTTWPPAGWAEIEGPPPCPTSFTDGLVFTCALPPEALTLEPPRPFLRYDFEGPNGEKRILYAPPLPRTERLLRALAVASEGVYTPAP